MFRFYLLTPTGYRKWVEDYVGYADLKVRPESFMNFAFLFSFFIFIFVGLILFLLNIFPLQFSLLIALAFFVCSEIAIHSILVLTADSRAKFTEEILPDALQLISANIRSGLTMDKAILTSARPEFGPLEQELRKVAKETISGRLVEEALKDITKRIKSKLLERTISLLIEGIKKGGNVATLLDSVAEDIRQTKTMRREIKSYVMMYGIFIFFAICIGAPLLYSVSIFLVQTMAKFSGIASEEIFAGRALPIIGFRKIEISQDFLVNYSLLSLIVSSIFGSLLIGLIQEGSEKAGLKLIPIISLISIGILFATRVVLISFLGIV